MRSVLIAFLLLSSCARKDPSVRLAVVQASFAHMPAGLSANLGFFQEEGVEVSIESLPSTTQVMQALLAGSIDIATTTTEHLLQVVADGRDLRLFVVQTARSVAAIAVAPNRKEIRTVGDLKGHSVGVAGIGSATHQYLNFILSLNGLKPEDISTAGIGTGRAAMEALERGAVDAASISSGEIFRLRARRPELVVLADTTTPEGSLAILGSEVYPIAALAAKAEWLARHPTEARRVARAVQKALRWLDTHSAEEIRERLPEGYRTDDVAGDLASLRAMKSIWSKNGVMPADGLEIVRRTVARTQEKIRNANIDLSRTYTNEFVKDTQ